MQNAVYPEAHLNAPLGGFDVNIAGLFGDRLQDDGVYQLDNGRLIDQDVIRNLFFLFGVHVPDYF